MLPQYVLYFILFLLPAFCVADEMVALNDHSLHLVCI